MILTNRRTNVVDVTYLPEGRSVTETRRHPAEDLGYGTLVDVMDDEAHVVDQLIDEYETRQRGEVIQIMYLSTEPFGRSLYENPRF